MRVEQYSYFALSSETVPAADISVRLGVEPDEVLVRGSRRPELDLPRAHVWKIVRRGDERVDEQVEHVVERLKLSVTSSVRLTAGPEVAARLTVVRYFRGGVDRGNVGWWVSAESMEFLAAVRATLDVDEYDLVESGDDSLRQVSTELLVGVERNLAEHACHLHRHLPGATVAETDDLLIADSGLDDDTFNIVAKARFTSDDVRCSRRGDAERGEGDRTSALVVGRSRVGTG